MFQKMFCTWLYAHIYSVQVLKNPTDEIQKIVWAQNSEKIIIQ